MEVRNLSNKAWTLSISHISYDMHYGFLGMWVCSGGGDRVGQAEVGLHLVFVKEAALCIIL
jgi:hypothetical protein